MSDEERKETGRPASVRQEEADRIPDLQTGHGIGIIRESAAPYGTENLESGKTGRYTIHDYYALPDDRRAELIEGEIFDMAAPSFVHQRILADFYFQVQSFFNRKNGRCQALMSPVDVRLFEDEYTMVQPDFLILCDQAKARRWGIMGAPDFVLEIVSEFSARRDYVKKVSLYMEAGVREFWLIDPLRERLLIYTPDGDGIPYIGPLKGKRNIWIYAEEELLIDLDRIRELITDYPE